MISLEVQNVLKTSLTEHGLHKTWASLLQAHVRASGDKFAYILSHPDFSDAEPISDLLSGLSVGEVGILYEFSLAFVDFGSRAEQGQYFTPDDVAQFMVSHINTFDKDKVWLDPCSGVGNLSYWLVKAQDNPEEFILNNLILVDRDPLAVFIASVIMATHFQDKEDNLFNDFISKCVIRDYLADEPLPQHDYTLMNPPYVQAEQDTRFASFKAGDLYAYFLEKAVKHSEVIAITPQSFLNAGKFAGLRSVLAEKALTIYAFDNVPDTIFKGFKFGSGNSNTANSTRAAITIVQEKTDVHVSKITPLLRWRSAERETMFASAKSFLAPFTPTEEILPKCGASLKGLYDELASKPALKTLLSARPTEWKLTVPSSPRYFTPAVKRELSRSSTKVIYFKNEEDFKKAYLLLNSSLFYWWWRVMDGGMTISLKTIQTLPVPDFSVDESAITLLEKSESENVVVKMNAGKPNENVKHPVELVQKLNALIAPDYATALFDTHKNSCVN